MQRFRGLTDRPVARDGVDVREDARGIDHGHAVHHAALLRLVREALVAPEEALVLANHPDTLKRQIAELPQER